MPKYVFFASNGLVKTAISDSVYAEQLSSSPELKIIEFEAEANDKHEAQLKLKSHLEQNTETLKDFGGDVTLSSIIESLLR
ncbi:hypothetical protein PMPD1_0132 [Paramixta manurensis]|uniref:Uncharacterized protein n=1 Tax=Paramixta manurensis TaxID=2740817 RepID=A0A6M8U3D6_9GAMM|nr:hypothetical protein PMPD1_0132 [Erwiniaceae bacterium PD-1]